jgi:hypothetical protein
MFKSFLVLAGCTCMLNTLKAQSNSMQRDSKITVTNLSSVPLTDKAVAIKRARLSYIPKGTLYPLLLSLNNDTIPVQLDDLDGDKKWDELFFVADLSPKGIHTYSLKWVAKQPQFIKRTSVRFGKRSSANTPVQPATEETVLKRDMPKSMGFQRYQTDGPSWENDKVGFRHYLDGRNAKDVFGKRVSYMSPETVGINRAGAAEDNYHVMEEWGRDVMAVQNSIGIGGVAMLKRDSLMRLGVTVNDSVNNVEKTTFRIITEGPVRSVINFKYFNWKPVNRSYNVDETTSIWPGMYAYNNTVKVSGLEGDENLLIGIVSIFATKPPLEVRINDKWIVLVSHDKHSYNKEWWLPLAIVLPADAYLGFIEAPKSGKLSNSYLAKMKVSNNKPVNYFAVAGWELSDEGFKDPFYFRQYVENLVQQLSAEIKVTVK